MQLTAFIQKSRYRKMHRTSQILRIMRLTCFFLISFCLQIAARSNGQTVNLSVKNAGITQVLKQIQEQTGYNIIAENSLLEKIKKVNVQLTNVRLEEALNAILKEYPITYTIQNKTIIFKAGNTNNHPVNIIVKPVEDIAEILVFKLEGRVTDANGKPMVKVSVYNNTLKKGTTTNDEGTFIIDAEKGDIITFSYIGYKPEKITVVSSGKVSIEMELVEKDLEEIVATGYQNIRKSNMTGAVAKIKSEDLLINGATTIEQALQGKLAGVEITNTSGLLGTRQTVRVRGVSTLLGNQEPVWVVDGIIQEDPLPFKAKELNRFNQEPSNSELLKNFIGSTISWLNPYDIDEITVLKDAASTAIYGVKAANGVILITTKRGVSGRRPVVTYNTSFSTQSKLSYDKLNLMNSKERVDVSREIWERGLIATSGLDNVGYLGLLKQFLEDKLSYDAFYKGVKQLEVNNTDWLDILFQQPLNQSHSISVSGGGETNSYYGSFGVNSQKGVAKGNGVTSYQGSVSFISTITPKLTFTAKVAGNYSKTDGFLNIDPYKYATQTSRVIPAFNTDGSYHYYNYWNTGFRYNILNELEESGNSNVNTALNSNLSLRYRFIQNFTFESLFGINYSNISGESYASERTHGMTVQRGYEYAQFGPNTAEYKQSKLPFGGRLSIIDNSNYNYTWRNGINYGQTFSKVHVVTGLAGIELRSNIYKATNSTVYGYMPDMGKVIIAPPPMIQNTAGTSMANVLYSGNLINTAVTDRESNYVSYYATGGYTYDNRYVLSASIRADASNRFGQDVRARFKPIWSVGGKWNVANERFFQKTDWFNDFSIRASYGYQGNVAENFGPDLILKIPDGSSAISNLTGERVYRVGNLPYSDLRWEKTQTVNLGLEFNFLKGRLGAVVDYYNKNSRDVIVMKDVPYENGVKQMPVNSGTIINSGVDVNLNIVPVRTKDFTWTLGAVFAKNFNKVTNRTAPNPTWNTAKSGTYYKEGYAVSSFWVFDFAGVDSATGIPLFNKLTTENNTDAKFDAAAFMTYAGKLNPDYTGGCNTSFRYKTFTLSSSMYFSVGAHKLLAPLYTVDMIRGTPYEYNNLSKDLVNRWRKPGDEKNTNIPSLPQASVGFLTIPSGAVTYGDQVQGSSETPYTLYNFSTARVVNASYFRINNIALSYSIPPRIIKHIYSKTATIGYSINNLLTIVSKDFKGGDAEVASGSQPLPRIHAINLSISF